MLIGAALALPASARADEVRVMISGGFSAAYKQLVPQFEGATGHKVSTAYGPSMGSTENAIPVRLNRGEPVDVLIMVGEALTGLTEQGKADKDSRVDLARSPIGVAVRAGAPKPDISTVDALRTALLNAKSVAYSDSASGVYVENELFKRLGIEEQMKGTARMIPAEPVAAVVARGEAELGFQQISELLPVAGVDVVGPIPESVQKITIFSAGMSSKAGSPKAGAELTAFLASPQAAPVISKTGLDPIAHPAAK
ncbi:substrate-binding domain-containing protein [Xanthobacter sp. 126]|uniref:substrate-binding domain-containing protein n=1 Tax=Xanthobacter sp. 126 TaxID=1131814 RepID=UPI0004B22380|nr:substrate-binding domain-containing protein [Xanthobacter sp. 126]